MFDGTLSFDRVLMPASQASAAWSGLPFHCAHPAEDVQVSQSWRLACPLRRSPFIWLTVYAVPLSPRWEANLRQRTGFSCSFIQPLHKVFKGHHGLALPVPGSCLSGFSYFHANIGLIDGKPGVEKCFVLMGDLLKSVSFVHAVFDKGKQSNI